MSLKESTVMIVRRALEGLRSDDLRRAEMAWRDLDPEQMSEVYGQSGQTRQQILDGYRERNAKVDAAIRDVEANS